jgi:iron-sulfur cluster repair protein YtfE (RIC family)
MALVEIRELLLSQHRAVRAQIEQARALATSTLAGEEVRAALRECLQSLAGELGSHNAYEESVLQKVLPSVDAWGPVRLEAMTEEHTAEHRNLSKALLDAGAHDDPAKGAREVLRLLDRMLEHMVREEKVFLAVDVLTDDITTGDAISG